MDIYYHAQINDKGIVKALTQNTSRLSLEHEHCIEIDSFDRNLMGKKYVNGEFIDSNNYLYIHIGMADGDGLDPIGIINNGTDKITITATFRSGTEPNSSVITAVTGMSWRVSIRNNVDIYDIIMIPFINGVATVNYTTTGLPGICSISESDLEQITVGDTIYVLKIIGDTTFKVYRTL